ncbi:CoA ester lyase [uncultured Alsobacter sp.]|uniref:HpcH/HpaI aldolase/citrate lyase family protein n=1 Tax=uncultured Alsobacter sp. TaxID=1748258 RepID=UPI0025F47982|nr:CoA ester lyase [uncultured Alsobacter sp.]
MRSLLFVPGDSPRKLEKAAGSGADVLLIDLEDSVAPSAKEAARGMVRDAVESLRGQDRRPLLYVRVNALDSGLIEADLDAVMPAHPDGIMLPKSASGVDVQHLAAKLAVREAESGLPDGGTKIIPVATEMARALFALGTYRGASHRLAGLTWGAEDLAADIGAETNRLADGTYTDPFRLARSLALFAAHGAEVDAIDTVYTDFRNDAGFLAECEAARRDGFTAKMAIHPAQVPVINAVFTPSEEAVAKARRIVDAFAASPGVGVIGMDGQMVDRPHLRQAERVLARVRG